MDYSKQANQRKRLQKSLDQQRLVSKIWLNILRIVCIVVLIAVFIAGGALLGGFMGIIDSAPIQDDYDINDFTSYIYDADGTPITPIYSSILRSEVSIDQIPEHMQHAVVAIEDSRFYEHNGIDIEGILRSGSLILQGGDLQGGSTITQQVIKNLALSSDTAMTRKIQEWYMALQYEYQLTQKMGQTEAKRHILETYLNYVNFGNGNYGVQSASHFYYNKDVSEITIAEAAVLAGVLNAPSFYDPVYEPEASRGRQLLVLKAMYDQGYITESEYEAAKREDVFGEIKENTSKNEGHEEETTTNYTFFQEAAINQIQKELSEKLQISAEAANKMVYHGGLQIYLTQDQSIQDVVDYWVEHVNDLSGVYIGNYYQLNYALSIYSKDKTSYDNFGLYNLLYDTEEEALQAVENYRSEKLAEYEGKGYVPTYSEDVNITIEPQISIVIMDYHNGYVKAICGDRGEKKTDFALNRAIDTTRQPGSTFKVISSFAPALDGAGKTAATVYDDVPLNPNEYGWSPQNWWSHNHYFGFSTIRLGITYSMNLVAARCLLDIGPELGYDYATDRFGITSLEEGDKTGPMALGGLANGVSNLELSAAFSAIANEGTYISPTFYSKVLDHDGNVLLDKTESGDDINSHEAVSKQNAWILTDMMRDVVDSPSPYATGTGMYLPQGMPIAAKTGTTDSGKNYWLCGWSPYYLCTNWSGFDMIVYSGDYGSLSSAPNYDCRIPLWNAIMNDIHENLEYKGFPDVPEGVTTAYVCGKSGLLATSSCGSHAYTEYFVEGTVPTSYCNVHEAVAVCSITGLRPTSTCPVTYRYGVYREENLYQLAQILAARNPELGFSPGYVEDYVPTPSATCPGHYVAPPDNSSGGGETSTGGGETSTGGGETSTGGGETSTGGGETSTEGGTGTGGGEDTGSDSAPTE